MSPRLTVNRVKRIVAILIAIAVVLAAGVIVGQAPQLFGAELEDPEAEIEFEDQDGDGESVEIDRVRTSDGGFVVVTDSTGTTLGVSEYLGSGEHENVTVERDEDVDAEMLGQLTATVHQDTTDDESFAYEETDGEEDSPYLEAGFPVSATAAVTPEDRDELERTSFVVDSVDGPTTVTTNDTLEVTAEISNPTDLETSQQVDLRLDGVVYGQQAVELAPEESREVTFEVDAGTIDPGEYIYGVYTDGDGELGELEVVFEGPSTLENLEADATNATVDAALTGEGFVAIEDEDGDALGTSEALTEGFHANVTVEFDESVEDGEVLTAVLYAGEPDDREDATPFEEDGEPVEATTTVDLE